MLFYKRSSTTFNLEEYLEIEKNRQNIILGALSRKIRKKTKYNDAKELKLHYIEKIFANLVKIGATDEEFSSFMMYLAQHIIQAWRNEKVDPT